MSEELINYILAEIRNGHQTTSVESFLKTHGYNPEDVETSIQSAIDLTAKTYIPYIESQISAGYELPVIRTALMQQGYDQRIVDYAINHYFNNFVSKIKQIFEPKKISAEAEQRKQQQEQIHSYITTNLQNGFSLENIRSTLSEQGFNQAIINAEINKFYQSHFHISKQNAFAMLAIFLAVIVVGSFGFFIFGNNNNTVSPISSTGSKSQSRLLDVNVENAFPTQKISAGDNVNFNIDIDNMGTEREYDLYFTYTLLDANDKKIRTKKVTKSTISSMNDYLQIPKTVTSGTYKLKVSVEYKGDIPAEAYFEFTIQKEITETTPVDEKTSTEETTSEPETTPEQIEETKQEVIETQRKVTIKDPLEPGTYLARSYLTTEEKNQLETYISTEGIDYALFKCRQITFPALELECKYYSIIANNEQSFCSILDEGIRRDKCYLAFAKVSTDLEICKEIEEASVVSACKMHILNNKNKLLLENNNQGDFYKTFNEVYGDGTLNATGLTQQETE